MDEEIGEAWNCGLCLIEEMRVWLGTRCLRAMLWTSDLARGIVMVRELFETRRDYVMISLNGAGRVHSRRVDGLCQLAGISVMGNEISD